jgi:hypothetical protein
VAPAVPRSTEHAISVRCDPRHFHAPVPSTGRTSGTCSYYVKDHIKPLACGGPDAVSKLQWQTIRDAKAKDEWETKGCAR